MREYEKSHNWIATHCGLDPDQPDERSIYIKSAFLSLGAFT